MRDLTARQAMVLQTIQDHRQQKGYVPTVRELGVLIGATSTCTVQRHIEALERKGYVQRTIGKVRCLQLVRRKCE